LGLLYPTVATELLKRDDYWFRESDHWHKLTKGKISEAEFAEHYAKRDNATLQASVMTNIFAPLIKMVGENQIAINDGRPNKEIAIVVNIWPYRLDDLEMEAFVQCFNYRLGFEPRITFVSWPLSALTPALLTNNYALAFMYHFNDWIKIHLKNLVSNRTQGFNLIVPRLFEHDASKLSIEDKQDEITKFRLYLMEYMNIHFIDASNFSVFRPV
jgi:hypothetical protein